MGGGRATRPITTIRRGRGWSCMAVVMIYNLLQAYVLVVVVIQDYGRV